MIKGNKERGKSIRGRIMTIYTCGENRCIFPNLYGIFWGKKYNFQRGGKKMM
jgi:hypothetical protein